MNVHVPRPWATWSALATLAIAFLLQPAGGASSWALQPANFVPWQLASYALVHAGWGHLVANAALLAWLGPRVEYRVGRARFGLVLASAAVAGGGAQLVAAWAAGPGAALVPIVGASGALYGLLGACWRLWPADGALRATVAVFGGLALVGALGGPGSEVAAFAHLGGLLAGCGIATGSGPAQVLPAAQPGD